MTDTPEPTQGRTPRWIKIVLTLSLALNLLIIGAGIGVVGRFAGKADHDRAKHRPEGALIAAFERGDIRDLFKDVRKMRREGSSEGPDVRPMLLEALRAEPFDPARLQEVFDLRKEGSEARGAVMETALINKLTEFSAEKRAAYADRLEQHLRRTKKRH